MILPLIYLFICVINNLHREPFKRGGFHLKRKQINDLGEQQGGLLLSSVSHFLTPFIVVPCDVPLREVLL